MSRDWLYGNGQSHHALHVPFEVGLHHGAGQRIVPIVAKAVQTTMLAWCRAVPDLHRKKTTHMHSVSAVVGNGFMDLAAQHEQSMRT